MTELTAPEVTAAPQEQPYATPPLRPSEGEDVWDDDFDVVVVGMGAAGSAAALEATRTGARVLVLDRFKGGGATARSGGIVYIGGGSAQQKLAGYEDSPEEMYAYLRSELGRDISEPTLRGFCEESLGNLAFLENLGVPFPPQGDAPKTSYPPDECTLYFSGNELCPPHSSAAKIAPRGHRVLGKGLTGNVLFRHLAAAVEASPAEIQQHSRTTRLVVDDEGCVIGVEVASIDGERARRMHAWLDRAISLGAMIGGDIARSGRRLLQRLEQRRSVVRRIRARRGVVLCAGGFVFNSAMMRHFAPEYAGCMALGTSGDDGSGISLGHGAGGALGHMNRATAWRFINPPVALTHGVLVDSAGRRICNEELYGASLGERITEDCDGRAWLVIDGATWSRVFAEIIASRKANFQNLTALLGLFLTRERGRSIEGLARSAQMSPTVLRKTLDEYNERCDQGLHDELGKSDNAFVPQAAPPYYAIRCDSKTAGTKAPCLTLGGLVTNPASGQVLHEDGSPIGGLYAAGRNAVGVCSHSYVSGLSIADCVFSGRRAGVAAATR
jgi:3-oxo-5alpha-steroid 4-dehydrogenase